MLEACCWCFAFELPAHFGIIHITHEPTHFLSMTDRELQLKAIHLRKKTLEAIFDAGAGHTGGGLSCLDILNVLYNRILNVSPENFSSPTRDRYVQSKGHSVEALYAVLADRGFFPESELKTICRYQSYFIGHPTRHVPGIEMNTGALGHGLPICIGMALAGKMDSASYRVFTLLGDGELAEGSNWEAALAAAHYKLDNLTAFIDLNGLMTNGRTDVRYSTNPLADKWRAFGWFTQEIDGHDVSAILAALDQAHAVEGKPKMIICRTIKGKGIPCAEGRAEFHNGILNQAQYEASQAALQNIL
jgi:transketolase